MEKTGEPQEERSRSSTRCPQTQEDMTYHPPPTPRTVPMSTIKINTLNINGITAWTRVWMLADFIRQHDFDIISTKEVTSTEVLNVHGYNVHLNILAKGTLHLTTALRTSGSGRLRGSATYKRIRTVRNSKAGRQRTILYHRAAIFVTQHTYLSAY